MEIPASSLGKGGPQVAQHSTVQTVPTASRSRLRHLALLCDHADIAPRSIFSFPLPLPLPLLSIDLLPGIWNEPWCRPSPPSPPLPSSVPVAGSFEIACGLVFDFPVSAPSPRCPPPVAATPPLPLEPPLGDDRYLFPSHELAFLVPDRGDVSEAGWARLIKPPLDLTTLPIVHR